jgi:hypothetical protein
MARKNKERMVLSRFMDRVEPEVFASLAEEVKKRRRSSKKWKRFKHNSIRISIAA